ncbi:MAG: RNA methyltransferase [Mycoplasmataceae bacterium]|nr:RNA methyltransferase [Mycoplasmataceae bacterium]
MITSLTNEKIKNVAKLHKKKFRDQENKFIVEGFHLVEEAKKLGLVLEVYTSLDDNLESTYVSRGIIKKLSSTVTPQPILAVCRKPFNNIIGNRILALDNIQDPGNVGTLIRSAKAFGFDTVVVNGVDVFNQKVIRSSQGAIFGINLIQSNDIIKDLKGIRKIGAILDKDAKTYDKLEINEPFALILGNEGNGITEEVISRLDDKIYIPIEFESLNVASAGAILMNEYKKTLKSF